MINNLHEYFLPEQRFYLDQLNYERINTAKIDEEHSMNCTDHIKVEVYGEDMVRLIVTRSLYFEPNAIFQLSVAYGAELRFDIEKVKEYRWDEINLAEEFRENGDFVTANLLSRISLMIGQITASFGQYPLILPPQIVKNDIETI